MVDLKAKPYFLSDEQVKWVEDTIASMTEEEKVGQLFVNMVTDRDPEALKKVLDQYHVGAIRYHNVSPEELYAQNKTMQDHTRIPLLIAANCEAGGNGGVNGGTPVAFGAAVAAADSEEAAYEAGRIGALESSAIGCNWTFAPIVDLLYNWRNTIVQLRAYNHNPDDVIRYAKAYMKGTRTQNMATCMKHFPGDGTEENDQHLIMGINDMSCEEWDETFGKVYRELIDEGVMTVMAGHIALPAYQKKLNPDTRDEDVMPATLCPELITGLLKGKLGFNGLVVTDASHMIGMFGATVPRSAQVPGAIAAGCDMFLFFNDREEDFNYMLEGYRNGVITEERMNDALHRILGLKAALNLHELQKDGALLSPPEKLKVIGCPEHREISAKMADAYVTLVKDTKKNLPMTPARYPRLKLMFIGGEGTVIAGKLTKGNDEEIKAEVIRQLEEAGFQVDAEDMAVKGKIEEFKKNYDAVLLVLNVAGFAQFNTMRVKWQLPTQQPWYMSEVPTIVLNLSFPNMLIDVPMAKTYINAYMNHPEAIHAALEKMMGQSEFKGRADENVFCGRWEAKL